MRARVRALRATMRGRAMWPQPLHGRRLDKSWQKPVAQTRDRCAAIDGRTGRMGHAHHIMGNTGAGAGGERLTNHRFQPPGWNRCVHCPSGPCSGSGPRRRRRSSMLTEAWRSGEGVGSKTVKRANCRLVRYGIQCRKGSTVQVRERTLGAVAGGAGRKSDSRFR